MAGSGGAGAGMVAVVIGAANRVREDLPRLVDAAHPLVGVDRLLGMEIRVMPLREMPMRTRHLRRRGTALDAKDRVRIELPAL